MAPLFPAILVGGSPPEIPYSLAYSLSRHLSEREIAHYVVRAGAGKVEGWSYLCLPEQSHVLRSAEPGAHDPDLRHSLARTIAVRHLPLIVEVGGLTAAEVEAVIPVCTHVVLLNTHSVQTGMLQLLAERHGLVPLIDLHSDRRSISNSINANEGDCGTISRVVSTLSFEDVRWATLSAQVVKLCAYTPDELYRAHLALTTIDLVLHLEKSIYPLPPHTKGAWKPADLAPLLASLPAGEPLAVYGAGPAWLYAALAAFSAPARFELFDPYYGWITPPQLILHATEQPGVIQACQRIIDPHVVGITLELVDDRLSPTVADGLVIPPVAAGQGVILDGELPVWLWAALARAYAAATWVGMYQPELQDTIVVRGNAAAGARA